MSLAKNRKRNQLFSGERKLPRNQRCAGVNPNQHTISGKMAAARARNDDDAGK
jgi:hypothetical protein